MTTRETSSRQWKRQVRQRRLILKAGLLCITRRRRIEWGGHKAYTVSGGFHRTLGPSLDSARITMPSAWVGPRALVGIFIFLQVSSDPFHFAFLEDRLGFSAADRTFQYSVVHFVLIGIRGLRNRR